MKLTKEDAIRLHREMWGWLAENPSADKADWPGWDDIYLPYPIRGLCFACEYTQRTMNKDCEECLFIWKTKKSHCCTDGSPFERWDYAIRPKTRSKYAAMIRDLPVRDDEPVTPTE